MSLARAFVLEPEIIFLDEPFSALDAPTRHALVDELGDILDESGTTAVFVTHDPAELRDLCDRCLMLDQGSVLQQGLINDVFEKPRSRRVAEIIGTDNLVTATVTRIEEKAADVDWDGEALRVPGLTATPGTVVSFIIRPQAIELLLPPTTVPSGALAGTIVRTRTRGQEVLVSVRLRNGRMLRALAPPGEHGVGVNAILIPKADAFSFIEPGHGAMTAHRSALAGTEDPGTMKIRTGG